MFKCNSRRCFEKCHQFETFCHNPSACFYFAFAFKKLQDLFFATFFVAEYLLNPKQNIFLQWNKLVKWIKCKDRRLRNVSDKQQWWFSPRFEKLGWTWQSAGGKERGEWATIDLLKIKFPQNFIRGLLDTQ